MNSGRSAWCSPAHGIYRHDAQHEVCVMQLEKHPERTCSCPDHLISKGSERSGMVESEAQSGPESALTDRGLATVSTRPKGA